MKKLILNLTLFLFMGNVFAQYTGSLHIPVDKFQVLDSATLKFTYRFTYVRDSLNPGTMKYVDLQTLLIAKNISKYYSQNFEDYCLSAMKDGKDDFKHFVEGSCGFEIFKDFPVKEMTVTDLGHKFLMSADFLYKEDIPMMNWVINNDTSAVLSYSCQKATTSFRGRNYEAWFTSEIPNNNGPWKFGGLPGLILKISDSKQNFVFECIGVEQLKNPIPIKLYSLKYSTLTRKDLMKIYRRLFDDPDTFFKSVGSEMAGQHDPKDLPKLPYNPMELE